MAWFGLCRPPSRGTALSRRFSHESPRAQTCTFAGPGLQKHHQNPREDPQRKREKERKWGREREKKERNFGPLTLRVPTLRGPTLRSLNLRGPTLRSRNLRSRTLRGSTLRGPTLRGPTLRSRNLRSRTLRGSTLRGPTLSKSGLSRLDLNRYFKTAPNSAQSSWSTRHLLQSHRCWPGVDERLCPCTQKAEIEVLSARRPYFIPVLIHGACAIMRVFRDARKTDAVDWKRHVFSLGGTI